MQPWRETMNKGELLSQPFIMIFALIVMALILIFGIKSFMDLKTSASTVELAKTVNTLQEEVTRYYNFDLGSSKKISLSVPSTTKKLCFYDKSRVINLPLNDYEKATIEASNNNLFFLPLDDHAKNAFNIQNLNNKETNNPYCISTTNGKANFIIQTEMEQNHVIVATHKP